MEPVELGYLSIALHHAEDGPLPPISFASREELALCGVDLFFSWVMS